MNVTISTKRPAQYLRGIIKQGFFPMESKQMWFVACESFAGGGRKVSLLSILDFKEDSQRSLIKRLRRFAKNQSYIIQLSKLK